MERYEDFLMLVKGRDNDFYSIKKQRRISELKRIPLKKWNTDELLDLIENYNSYVLEKINKAKNIYQIQGSNLDIYDFILDGIYEKRVPKEIEDIKRK